MTQKGNIAIFNFWWAANYGANLTAYALQQLIDNSILIDNSDFQQALYDSSQKFHQSFAKKYLNTSNLCISPSQLLNLSTYCHTFIVGSDQVFRPSLNNRISETFMLDFADINIKKIAFSASFGVDKEKFLEQNSKEKIENIKKSLMSFDFVSCREKSGVQICKEILGINAELIIDPVFILDKSKYDSLIKLSKKDFSGKILSCMFEKPNDNLDKFLEKKYNKQVIEIWRSKMSLEDWLNAIKNCELLVTNSYHAMCFAIIFNKPFIAISKDTGASSRFESLFEMLNIEDQCITSVNEIYKRDCVFNIDYENVNKLICEESKKGLDFLKMVLNAPTQEKKEKARRSQGVQARARSRKRCSHWSS